MLSETTDQIWLIACSGLVLLMQAGFLCLESGLTRSKNAVNVAVKNLLDFSVSLLLFYAIGFTIMFGASFGGWVGGVLPPGVSLDDPGAMSFLIFQSLFCATAATIVSGAVAERMLMSAYLGMTVVVSGLLYPLLGHWAWGGALGGEPGWLAGLGFVDFAGSGVVHMTGGFAALAAIVAIGPRAGRFDDDGQMKEMPPSNLSFVMLGALSLLVGWIGFNGGSTLAFVDDTPAVIWNTLLAAAGGGLGGVLLGMAPSRGAQLSPTAPVNGLLAGLVAVTASAHAVSPGSAIIIGFSGAFAMGFGEWLLGRLRLDDAVGAFPVHGAAGVWGLLCVALFGKPEALGPGHSVGAQFLVQSIGALTIAAMSYCVVRLALGALAYVMPLRATEEQQAIGLNVTEHGVRSELQVVCESLESAFSGAAPLAADEKPAAGASTTAAEAPTDDASRLVATYSGLIDRLSNESKIAAYAESQEARGRELEQQRAFLRTVLDALVAAVAILDKNGKIVETNRAWMHLRFPLDDGPRAISKNENLFEAFGSSVPNDKTNVAQLPAACQRVLDGEVASYDELHSLRGKSGKTWLQARVTPLPGDASGSVIVMLFDVTTRVEAERNAVRATAKAEMLNDAVEANQRVLRLAMEAARLSTWHWDVKSGHVEWSPEWPQTLGYQPGDLEPDMETVESLTHLHDLPLFKQSIASHFDGGIDRLECDYRMRMADGSFRWTRMMGRIVSRDDDGAPSLVAGVWSDIEDEKENEQRAASLAQVMEDLPNEVMIVDADTGRFIEVNRVARERLGYCIQEMRVKHASEVFEIGSDASVNDLADGSGVREGTDLRKHDGGSYPVTLQVERRQYLGRDVLVVVATDLTDRLKIESDLVQARKLEAIGQLAAGVAHEINTPMQFIATSVEFLEAATPRIFDVVDKLEKLLTSEELPPSLAGREDELQATLQRSRFEKIRADVPAAIADCSEGVARVIEIVRAMKEMSHPGSKEKVGVDLNDLVKRAATISRNRWKYVAELELQLAEDLPTVHCLPAELNQVVLNLIVNAADAISEVVGGSGHANGAGAGGNPDRIGAITVSTAAYEEDVRISISDTGSGMSAEVRDRLFEPFFTTKAVGKGTGQGLAISHDIVVNKHAGRIEVESEPGEGATFVIVLPRSNNDTANEVVAEDASESVPTIA